MTNPFLATRITTERRPAGFRSLREGSSSRNARGAAKNKYRQTNYRWTLYRRDGRQRQLLVIKRCGMQPGDEYLSSSRLTRRKNPPSREKRPWAGSRRAAQEDRLRPRRATAFPGPQARLIHLQDGSPKHGWRQVLDRKAQGFRDRIEPPVPDVAGSLHSLAGIETGARIIINHGIVSWRQG